MTSITRTEVTAKIPGLSAGDYTLKVKSRRIVLDEARVPYGELQLEVALPEQSVLDQITPYGSQRIKLDVSHSWETPARPAQARSFDFLLHERVIDHEKGTLTLRGVTDEGRLIDRINTSSVLDRTYGLSLKTAVDAALAKIGAVLEAGAVDAVLTSKTLEPTITNLITNPAEVNANLWQSSTTNAALTQQTTVAKYGTGCLRARATASTAGVGFFPASSSSLNAPYLFAVTAGQSYTWSHWVYTTLSGKTADARIRWGSASAQIGSDSVGAAVNLAPNTWTLVTVTATAPAGAINAAPWGGASGGFTSGQDVFFDGFIFTAGSAFVDYFDGSTPDTGLYDYAWTGSANASTSTKTNLPNTDATIWQPGQSLDDWLAPMLQASNRRLFCDELRKWRLVDAGYSLEGTVTISQGFNAKAGTDTMSRQQSEQGVPTWFDHVAVHYSWTDSLGVAHEAWDFASSGTVKGFTVEVRSPWPGPGAAAAILGRAAGRGRTQKVVALPDYSATPGKSVVITLPGTSAQSGTTSSVEWVASEDADEMTVTSRGLIATPDNAWIFALGSWAAALGSWAAATGTN